jgi:lysophospholipase L1-like esterase
MKLLSLFLVACFGILSPVTSVAAVQPMKRLVTIAPLGDSRTACIHFDTAHLNMTTFSFHNWANVLNQQQYRLTGNFGISGATSDKVVQTQLAPALATHPTYLTILLGVNDVRLPGFSVERTMDNLSKAANQALAQGVTPILFTDPGSEHYQPGAQVDFINALNERIKAYCAATSGAVLFDFAALISTQRSPTIAFKPGWSNDGIHLQTLGAYQTGVAFAKLLDSMGVEVPAYPGLAGNLLQNSRFDAGLGGKLGDGNSGTLPDAFTGSRDNANCSAAFSVKPCGDGGNELTVEVKTTAGNSMGGVRISQAIPAGNLTAADAFEAGVQVEIDPGSVNLADVRAEVAFLFTDGTFAVTYCFNGTTKRDTLSSIPTNGPLKLTLQAPRSGCPEGKEIKTATFRMGARLAGEGRATLRFRTPWCKKVPAVESGN